MASCGELGRTREAVEAAPDLRCLWEHHHLPTRDECRHQKEEAFRLRVDPDVHLLQTGHSVKERRDGLDHLQCRT